MKYLILVFCFFIGFHAQAQNLVPNPSFENAIHCPLGISDISGLSNWFSPTSTTPDYYNPCNNAGNGNVGVPENAEGYQQPHTGNAYAGILCPQWQTVGHNFIWSEYLSVQLTQTLLAGHKYYVSFYVNHADAKDYISTGYNVVATDNIGAVFTDTAIQIFLPQSDPGLTLNIQPDITSSPGLFITDTVNWIKIQGFYIAQGGEQYITLGFFHPADIVNNPISYQIMELDDIATDNQAYYYIDDVCVTDLANAVTSSRDATAGCNQALSLSGHVAGAKYTWSTGDTTSGINVNTSGTYWVAMLGECIYYVDTFHVRFRPLVNSGAVTSCKGQHNGRAWIQPAQGDTTTYTYTWTDTFGNTLQPAATSSIIADTLYNQSPGTYTVNISGLEGCDTFLSVIIPVPNDSGFLHASDTGICPHDTITIHATGGVSYHWQPDNRTYINDTSIADPQISPATDWSYIVYGTSSSGCLDTVTAHVRVFPNAVIQLPDSVILYYGGSFQFSPATNCSIFSWFPPLGLNADNISNPIASPPVNTRYIVTGTTAEGCTVKDSVNVYRSNEVILTLPNAFTPGNGPDNLFKPIHEGDVVLDYLRIFNRWGQIVYESSDLNQGWDGTFNSIPQPEGAFIYMMQGHTNTGRTLFKQGNVTLLR